MEWITWTDRWLTSGSAHHKPLCHPSTCLLTFLAGLAILFPQSIAGGPCEHPSCARVRMMRTLCTTSAQAIRVNLWSLLLVNLTFAASIPVEDLVVPVGFNVSLYADRVPDAGYLAVSRTLRPPTSLTYLGTNSSQV